MDTLPGRYKQANKEAKWALVLTAAYFAWWYISAYGLGSPAQDLSMPQLYFGFPLWFLLSCIIGPIVFTLLCALMVKFCYRDISLEVKQEWHHE